jgi:rhamnosyltransferase
VGTTAVGKGGTKGGTVCAVVVTYNSDAAVMAEVVAAAIPQLDELIVMDNGSAPERAAEIRALLAEVRNHPARARITERFGGENRGLAIPFNEAIGLARQAGHQYILFLDHDSILAPDTVERLCESYSQLEGRAPLGGIEAYNDEPATLPTDEFLRGHLERKGHGDGAGAVEDFLLTNSGLFVSPDVAKEAGGFDETFFLDALDFEFGLRLWSRGLKVYKVTSARIRHQRGEAALGQGPGAAWQIRRVSPTRHYYVGRDVVRTLRRYGRRFPLIGLILLSMPFRELGLILLFYHDRRPHLHYLGLGVVHGLEGRGGSLAVASASR